MKISDIFKTRMSFSFEVFPAKDGNMEPLLENIEVYSRFRPDFISCTYGAGGGNRDRTVDICRAIKACGHEVLAHFTCIGNSKEQILHSIEEYKAMGVENMLALRGDLPQGWEGTRGAFYHADRLISFIREHYPECCIAACCYPEKHIQAESMESDMAHLRQKQESGAELLISQLCHDVDAYERFVERIRRAGVHLPIVMGIMPVLRRESILRMTLLNGCSVPKELSAIIAKYGENPEDFSKAGKDYTAHQIHRYMNAGVDGIHIYSMNKREDIVDILRMASIRWEKEPAESAV